MRSPTAFITVICDRCKKYEENIELTATARGGYDERNVDGTLKANGWSIDMFDICPDCVCDMETEQMEKEEKEFENE